MASAMAVRTERRMAGVLGTMLALAGMTAPGVGWADRRDRAEAAKPAPYTGPKKRIAVMNMEAELPASSGDSKQWADLIKRMNGVNTRDDVGQRLTEMLTTALDNTGRFILLERKNVGDIRDEIKVGEELGNEKTAVKRGGVLGAQMLVRCAVTEFTDNKNSGGGGIALPGLGVIGGHKKQAALTLDVRFVDPATSRILFTAKAEGRAESKGGGFEGALAGIGLAFGSSSSDPIEKATRSAIEKAVDIIVNKMEEVAWEGRVARADQDPAGGLKVYVNRGSEDGLHEGDTLRLYRAGETVVDPDTGETLGRSEDKLLGECRIEWLDKRLARIVTASGITPQKGDVIKLAK